MRRLPAGAPDGTGATVPGSTVRAAGAVLWRPAADGGPEVAVVHRPHHGDWSLPKGKVDEGESRATTAVRELAEETGFAAVLGCHLTTVRYRVHDRPKTVDYWDARARAGSFAANGETDELRWLAPDDAAALVSYDTDRDVLTTFAARPWPLRPLLLVRHAKAGRRADWPGPDDERPLVDEGRAQASRIADRLALHGVTRVHAVPRTRCLETLAPLAARLGVDVVAEADLADEAVARRPGRARDRILELAATDGTAAVCAQGDGIPAVVRGLAALAPTPPRFDGRTAARRDDLPARKGSVWALGFHLADDGARLVAADYTRDVTD